MPDIFNSTKVQNNVNTVNPVKTSPPDKKVPLTNKIKALKTPRDMDRHKLFGHTHNPMAAFCYYPDKVSFVNEDPQEEVILFLRKHPITNIRWLTVAFFMFILPSFFSLFSPFDALPNGYQLVISLVWYLITSAFILEQFLSWFFQVNLVTDERIIEVDFANLVYREMTDANLNQIQDVTVEVSGVLRTFFTYGDVIIQTAAQVPKITFEAVPNPDLVARVLRDLRIEEEVEELEGRVR